MDGLALPADEGEPVAAVTAVISSPARALELRRKTCHESTRSRGACGGHGAPPSGRVARRSRAHVWPKPFRGNESPGMLCDSFPRNGFGHTRRYAPPRRTDRRPHSPRSRPSISASPPPQIKPLTPLPFLAGVLCPH